MIKNMQKSIGSLILSVLLLAPTSGVIFAGSNHLTKYESVSGTGYFDLVVSLDWNPTAADKNGLLKTAFAEFGKNVFTMSEGKQKIRKIYVFVNSAQIDKADIRLLNKGGRSNANISGISNAGGRILTYTKYSSGNARTATFIGNTLAHEFGHYAYSVFDEYRGSVSTATRLSTPLSGDTPHDTIMCSQGSWQCLSTATDYEDADDRKTGQWRVFRSSAWETLVRDPKNDKLSGRFTLSNPRVRYGEFENIPAPTILTQPTAGWDSQFEVVYKGGNITVLVIDKSAGMANERPSLINSTKGAAKQFVDLMKWGDAVAVVTFDTTAATLVEVTPLTNQAAKNSVKNKIDTIATGGASNHTAALNKALSLIDATGYAANSRYVVFLSGSSCNTGTCPPAVTDFAKKEIPIHTIGLGDQIVPSQLKSMAKDTGGSYYAAPNSEDLAKRYAAVIQDINGSDDVVDEQSGVLSTGGNYELRTLLSGRESSVTFRASWADGDGMNYLLIDPAGNKIDSEDLPGGCDYQAGGTYAIFTVANPAKGTWTSKITATTVTEGGKVNQQVSSESPLSIDIHLTGGSYPEPIGIMATLTGPEPIVGARVVASISVPKGATPIADIQLEDDEDGTDDAANDGVYTGVLTNYTADGVYTITIRATNPSGTAYLSTNGALEAGDDAPIDVLPPFQAMTSAAITTTGYGPLPGTPAEAMVIPSDNTRVWGLIKNNGDAVWYKLLAMAGTGYYLQTGDLISTDGTTMATRLTLYEADAATMITSSMHYDGSDISYIEWRAGSNGPCYIKVEHASPGTGVFALTAGQTSLYQSGGGSSGSSRCFIATAAYGTGLHPYVKILKIFRNQFLLTSPLGRSFVAWYYRISPPVASALESNKILRIGVRMTLLPLIGLSYLFIGMGILPGLLLIFLALAVTGLGIRRLLRKGR